MQTSFPGSLIFLDPGASEERPWFGPVTCVPESGTLQLNCWREGRPSRNFVYTKPTGVRIMLSPKQTRKGREILPKRRKTYPSSDSGNPSWFRLCGLVQLGTLHIVKICSWRQNNNCTPQARQPRLCVWKIFESSLPRNESKPCLLWRGLESGDWIILEYSGPWSLEAEVSSKGARRWKDLLKCHCAVGALNFAEHEAYGL